MSFKKLLTLSCMAIIMSSTPVFSQDKKNGTESGGGGSEVAINFLVAAKKAVAFVSTHQDDFPEFKGKKLSELIAKVSANLTVSSNTLYVDLENGGIQESSAESLVSDSGEVSVILNGASDSNLNVGKITDPTILSALALHELAVLLKIEKTGDYHVSQRFLSANKIICTDAAGICTPDESGVSVVYFTLQYDSAQLILAENILYVKKPIFISSEAIDGITKWKISAKKDLTISKMCQMLGAKDFSSAHRLNHLSFQDAQKNEEFIYYGETSQNWITATYKPGYGYVAVDVACIK